MLKDNRDKAVRTLSDLHVTISDKTKLLTDANNSIANLKLKLETLEKTLSETRAREKTLIKDLANERQLPQNAAASHNELVADTKLWTNRLVDVTERLTT